MNSVMCSRCNGSRKLYLPPNVISCPICNGTGTVTVPSEPDRNSGGGGGDVLPWLMASAVGIFAWVRTHDEATTFIAAAVVAAVVHTKVGRWVAIGLMLYACLLLIAAVS